MEQFRIDDRIEEEFQKTYQKTGDHSILLLIRLYKGNYKNLFLSVFFFIIKHSPSWVLPLITSGIINIVTYKEPDGFRRIAVVLVFMAVLTGQNVISSYFHVRYKSLAVRQVEAGLRATMVRKLQHLSILYHKQMSSGRLQSKIMRDVEAVESLSTQLFINIVNIVLSIGIALFVTLSKSPTVFLFFLLTIPLASVTVYVFKGKMKASNREFRREVEHTSGQVMEMMELIPVTRAHALEEEEINKMKDHLEQVAQRGYELDVIQTLFGATGWVIFQISQLLCLGFTAWLALGEKIQVGDVILYQTYFTTIINQITSIMNLVPIMAKGFESLTSIGEVLLAHDEETYKGKKKIKKVEGAFAFENVSYSYPDAVKPILDGFSLKVKKGETIAFVGESGAGKSTVLNLIIGFMRPDGGRILLDGVDMAGIDLHSFRSHLAVVPQNTVLFSGTVRDNITYGLPDVTEEELNKVLKAANLKDVIEGLPEGLSTRLGEHGDKLSGGQKQRISIARAFLRNPEVIILDEATSALDSVSEKKVQKAFERLSAGRTTFMVAHRLSTIKSADRIVVVADGVCTESGTYEELLEQKGRFYQLNKAQNG